MLTVWSPINQTIALKTIKKLGFSVNAVWNGQEALDYLKHNNADIILMDVQMPIMDGYRATHIIRHHPPFIDMQEIQRIPIIAMTASAIQGDREKCQKAGMDDYLAKPVKGKLLEKMLLKWAVEGRKAPGTPLMQRSDSHDTDHDSLCPDRRNSPAPGPAPAEPPVSGTSALPSGADLSPANQEYAPGVDYLNSQLDKLSFTNQAALSHVAGTENERQMYREGAKEQAMALRDDKLLAATGDPPPTTLRSVGETGAQRRGKAMKLTAENVSKLADEQGRPEEAQPSVAMDITGDRSMESDLSRQRSPDVHSTGRQGSGNTFGRSQASLRPTLGARRRYESDRTITPGSPRSPRSPDQRNGYATEED